MGCQQSTETFPWERQSSADSSSSEAPKLKPRPKTSEAHSPPEMFRVTLEKTPDMTLGAIVAVCQASKGLEELRFIEIKEGGLIYEWNKQEPSKAMRVGDAVVEVNGMSDSWAALRELGKSGAKELLIRRSSSNWQLSANSPLGASAMSPSTTVLTVTPLRQGEPDRRKKLLVGLLSVVRAADLGPVHCSICLDDVDPDEEVARLPCGHVFHCSCVAQWVQRATHQVCPLCKRPAM